MKQETRADLHIHSNYSDSSRSPEEIVFTAKERGVGLISVCDHGNIDAFEPLQKLCVANNIKCVLGIELLVLWENENLHVLAYNFDRNDAGMISIIESQKRDLECDYIIYNMLRDFPQMSLKEYRNFEYPRDKGGWKYIYYAVAKGVAASYEDCSFIYGKYSAPNHLSAPALGLRDFCAAVTQAEGVPVLAHPGYLSETNSDTMVRCFEYAIECGIGGIECYYPSHSAEVTKVCVDFCKENDLRITGGCDCHGDFDKSEGYSIGALEITSEMLDLRGII